MLHEGALASEEMVAESLHRSELGGAPALLPSSSPLPPRQHRRDGIVHVVVVRKHQDLLLVRALEQADNVQSNSSSLLKRNLASFADDVVSRRYCTAAAAILEGRYLEPPVAR